MAPEQSTSKIGKSVGEKIRAARIALKYTQSQLASPDFSVSYISAIERGQIHPSLRALEIIAGRLGLPSAQFLPQRTTAEASAKAHLPEREEDESEFILFDTYLLLAQGQGEQMLAQLGKVSARRLRRDLQMHHRYLTAYAYYLLDRAIDSEPLLVLLTDTLKEDKYSYIYLHALDLLGQVRSTILTETPNSDANSALVSLHLCLKLLNEASVRDSFLLFRVYVHLGMHAILLNDFDNAQEMFTHAIDVSHEFEAPRQAQQVYNTLYANALAQEDFFVATLYAYQVLLATQQLTMTERRGELYYALGKTLVERESRNTTTTALLDGANKASQESDGHEKDTQSRENAYRTLMEIQAGEKQTTPPDALTMAALDINIGSWLLAHQRLQEAEQCAREAILLAQDAGDTLILAEAHLLSGKVAYAQERFDGGDAQFAAGLAIFERLHLEEEIAHNSLYYAQQLEQRGKAREALSYFRRAFQSGQNVLR